MSYNWRHGQAIHIHVTQSVWCNDLLNSSADSVLHHNIDVNEYWLFVWNTRHTPSPNFAYMLSHSFGRISVKIELHKDFSGG